MFRGGQATHSPKEYTAGRVRGSPPWRTWLRRPALQCRGPNLASQTLYISARCQREYRGERWIQLPGRGFSPTFSMELSPLLTINETYRHLMKPFRGVRW